MKRLLANLHRARVELSLVDLLTSVDRRADRMNGSRA
jgi:hypothetical protein